jgi:hypothetical protein
MRTATALHGTQHSKSVYVYVDEYSIVVMPIELYLYAQLQLH